IFKREKLVNEKNVFHGYAAYLKYLQCSQDRTLTVANRYGTTDLDHHQPLKLNEKTDRQAS
ncbi:MAG: hypothetical protein ACXWC3_28745, partial [Burkholderiales bacterium]